MKLTDDAEAALLDLLRRLDNAGYDFVAPTPATHARLLSREPERRARDLRDVFGWSLPFDDGVLPSPIQETLLAVGVLVSGQGGHKSRVRVSRVAGRLFLHSAYPTDEEDAVFLGPDTYRFVDFVRAELTRRPGIRRLVDLGTGSGAGAICAAPLLPGARLTLIDTNPTALRLASVNARHAGVEVERVHGDSISNARGAIDLVIANPPYIMDDSERTYRDGGGMHGAEISLDWALEAAKRLNPGGLMLLYTGSAIVSGRDALREALARALPPLGCSLSYREIDPDVFGEELEKPRYADVERITAIGAVIEKTGRTQL